MRQVLWLYGLTGVGCALYQAYQDAKSGQKTLLETIEGAPGTYLTDAVVWPIWAFYAVEKMAVQKGVRNLFDLGLNTPASSSGSATAQ
jgi:hypothetical protein